ncbi:MAG: isocitrate/isopropylmalate dehydrogenase family protein [Chloroflexi bacterium]|nr:isocitrate/isopropylmalate dehydrogenase family protein [Chloroflexota bacterium]
MKKVCVIEGDDAAPEAVRPAVEVLETMELPIKFLRPLTGEAAMRAMGSGYPEAARRAVDEADTTLFGATSGKTGGAIRHLRFEKQTFANLRPIKYISGARSPLARPQGIDYVIIRENLEDLYLGAEGGLDELWTTPLGAKVEARGIVKGECGRYALKVITERGSRRVAEFACRVALHRKKHGKPGRVTAVAKYNLLRETDGLFCNVVRETVARHPELRYDEYIVDNFARMIVAEPHGLDVVVIPNLYGDILSDAGAGTIGGLGITPSGCFGERYAYFEPVHGTAPDIAGRGIINPTATLLSAVLMLEYLGMNGAAQRLERAVEAVYADGNTLTPDQGGRAKALEFCDAVKRKL